MSELQEIRKAIRHDINRKIADYPNIEDAQLQQMITEEVLSCETAEDLGFSEKESLIVTIYNAMRKLDILQPYLDDESVSEIMINGPTCIFIERAGRMERLNLAFETQDTLHNIIQNVVTKVNRSVNETSPIVDARLDDGSRVAVILPPIALEGPVMTIRKFPSNPLTMEHLLAKESITKEAVDLLQRLVRCKYNLFISGGTSSGKTTFLNILSGFIPDDERLVTIEDAAELQIKNKQNLVRLEARLDKDSGCKVSIKDLIKTALRLRPDRIIVGEVRGQEALDMLQAMNTGHEGSLSTGHANNASDAMRRLEVMAVEAGDIPLFSIRQQIASAIDVVVQLSRMADGKRKVVEIAELCGISDDGYVLHSLFKINHKTHCLEACGDLKNDDKIKITEGMGA